MLNMILKIGGLDLDLQGQIDLQMNFCLNVKNLTILNFTFKLVCLSVSNLSELGLTDPTQVESKKTSQIQWPFPSIKVQLVDVFLVE